MICDECDEDFVPGHDAAEVVRDWLDKQRIKPCPPTREQVAFVEELLEDL